MTIRLKNTCLPNRTAPKSEPSTSARRAFLLLSEFLVIAMALAAVPFVILLDTTVFGTQMSEHSLTELMQGMLIGLSSLAFGWGAVNQPKDRGYLALMAALFGWMFLRENDAVFDLILQGFWQLPATAMLLAGITIAWRNKEGLLAGFLRHAETRQATYVFVGVLLLAVFSRLYGTGSLWQGIMGESYQPAFKAALQEGLELMAYLLIAYGALASFWTGFGGTR